jgi:hypothetical protein
MLSADHRLETVPGIGPILVATLIADLRNLVRLDRRTTTARKLLTLLNATPATPTVNARHHRRDQVFDEISDYQCNDVGCFGTGK